MAENHNDPRARGSLTPEKFTEATANLSHQISQNIEAIAALHAQSEQNVSRHQRIVETVTSFLGRPAFLSIIWLIVLTWVLVNLFGRHLGLPQWDAPPFYWLQGAASLSGLLMTTVVLITQNRQGKLAEQRAHLDLQVNLLAEQKIAKLIDLVEELRRDMPNVHNRHDAEAEVMKESADPHAVLSALEQVLEPAEDN